MIGLPVERPIEDAFETLEVNIKMNPTDSWVSIFQPMPKTELWRYCLKTGLLNPDINAQTFEDNTILNFEPEVANVINHLHKWWHYIVKYHFEKDFIDVLLEIQLSQSDKENLQELRLNSSKKNLFELEGFDESSAAS